MTSAALPGEEVTNMAVTDVENKIVKMLRDTACSSAIIKEDLFLKKKKTKLKEYTTLILADGTVKIFQRVTVDVDIPYFRAIEGPVHEDVSLCPNIRQHYRGSTEL